MAVVLSLLFRFERQILLGNKEIDQFYQGNIRLSSCPYSVSLIFSRETNRIKVIHLKRQNVLENFTALLTLKLIMAFFTNVNLNYF